MNGFGIIHAFVHWCRRAETLDQKKTSNDVFEHLIDFVYSQKITLIMATHNLELASKSDHQIKLV